MPESVEGCVIANPEGVRAGAPLLHASSAAEGKGEVAVRLRKDRRRQRCPIRFGLLTKLPLARLRVQIGVEYFPEKIFMS